jgi:FMN phosphatase YigB (HAD superfamily)
MSDPVAVIHNSRPVVFVDADNTLWNTDSVFAAAQLNLVVAVESAVGLETTVSNRLAFVRSVDQAIAERHHAGLRYPPRLLALAVASALRGKEIEAAARTAEGGGQSDDSLPHAVREKIEAAFLEDLQTPPALLPGVREGLHTLQAACALVLMLTEGSRAKALRIAKYHEIADSFDRVIESPKSPRLYKRILKLTGDSSNAYMIGDQLLRDIEPAMAAGVTAIYVPGAFKPRWELKEDRVRPDFTVEFFDEAALIATRGRDKNTSKLYGTLDEP